jgi:hypothetical protein
MRNPAFAALGIATIVIATPAQGQAPAEDLAATAINQHDVTKLNVYGNAKGEAIDNPALPGGKALRVTVAAKGANPWDSGVVSSVTQPVKAGDELVFVFFAKLVEGENGATSVTLPSNAVSLASPPHTALFGAPATIGTGWKKLRQRWIADKDYPAGTLQAALQLATGRQVIDIGPMFVSKMSGGAALPPPVKKTVVEDLSSKIVNDPTKPESTGVTGGLLKGQAPEGGDAMRVKVLKKGKNNWDSAIDSTVRKPVRKGDKLVLMFDARLVEGPGGATTANIPNASIQQKAEPYKTLGNGSPALTDKWQSFRYEGVADQDYAAGEVKGTIQVGNAKQTIDLANIVILNMGQ